MKSTLKTTVWLCLMVILPLAVFAEDLMSLGENLFENGKTNYESYKQAGDMFAKALEANPASYEAAWKACRSYCTYSVESQKKNVPNWKGICQEYGKIGMKYGDKAMVIDPGKVEGNYWFGASAKSYSEGVSVLTALKEGLKNKTQSSLEESYKINKMYYNGAPMKMLGRFWYVLPWPLGDNKLSLKYLREYQNSFPLNMDAEGLVFLAETLLKTGGNDEAITLLKKASVSNDKFYADWAKRYLAANKLSVLEKIYRRSLTKIANIQLLNMWLFG